MKDLTKQTFDSTVRNQKGVALIDFFAEWCGPCKMLGPVIQELAEEMKDETDVMIEKINVDEESELAGEFGVMSIPTVILFKDGKEVKRFVGIQSKDVYKNEIQQAKL